MKSAGPEASGVGDGGERVLQEARPRHEPIRGEARAQAGRTPPQRAVLHVGNGRRRHRDPAPLDFAVLQPASAAGEADRVPGLARHEGFEPDRKPREAAKEVARLHAESRIGSKLNDRARLDIEPAQPVHIPLHHIRDPDIRPGRLREARIAITRTEDVVRVVSDRRQRTPAGKPRRREQVDRHLVPDDRVVRSEEEITSAVELEARTDVVDRRHTVEVGGLQTVGEVEALLRRPRHGDAVHPELRRRPEIAPIDRHVFQHQRRDREVQGGPEKVGSLDPDEGIPRAAEVEEPPGTREDGVREQERAFAERTELPGQLRVREIERAVDLDARREVGVRPDGERRCRRAGAHEGSVDPERHSVRDLKRCAGLDDHRRGLRNRRVGVELIRSALRGPCHGLPRAGYRRRRGRRVQTDQEHQEQNARLYAADWTQKLSHGISSEVGTWTRTHEERQDFAPGAAILKPRETTILRAPASVA